MVFATGSAGAAAGGVVERAAEPPANCVESNDAGWQIWSGGASPENARVADALQAAVDATPEALTGVAFCSHYDGVVLYAAAADARTQEIVGEVQDAHPGVSVYLAAVENPLSTLLLAIDVFLEDERFTGVVNEIAPDIYTGGVRVSVPEPSAGLAKQIREALSAIAGRPVPVIVSQGSDGEFTAHFDDSAPYYMGGALTNAAGSLVCSSGIPITIGSTRRLLTAGHCSGTSYYNNGALVGSLYTTAFPGNADIFGDWQLLQGSTYAKRVFNGPVGSGSSLAITSAVWGGRPNGTQICSSGAKTGQICRYFVNGSYVTQTLEGVVVGHLLRMYHDSTGTGTQEDSAGWQHGDSGGSCYYADGAGGVIGAGITSGSKGLSAGGPYYYCTQLSGVRAWNSSATF